LQLAAGEDFSHAHFLLKKDGSGGTEVTVAGVPPPHLWHVHDGLTASTVDSGQTAQTISANEQTPTMTAPSTPVNSELVGQHGSFQLGHFARFDYNQPPGGSEESLSVGNDRPTLEVNVLGQYAAAGFAVRNDQHAGTMSTHTPPETDPPEPPWLARGS
jgi:hypothetical protein